MKIVIDLQSTQGISKNRGIGRYSLALSQELVRQAKQHDVYLLLNSNLIQEVDSIRMAFDTLIPHNQIKIFDAPKKISGHEYKNAWKISAAEKIREHFIASLSPDIVYITSIFEGWIDDVPSSIGEFDQNTLTASTLYDLIPFIYSNHYISKLSTPNFFFQKMQYLKRSNLLITLSDSASQEAIDLLAFPSAQIANCSVGIDQKFKVFDITHADRMELKNNYTINREFIFYIGGIDFRKNIIGLIEAFLLLPIRKKFQLVIIVSIDESAIPYYLNLFKQRFKLDADELILISYVVESTLLTLYNCCSVFVFPSLHEGFGLPMLEAMACGAPTIASNISSMPEAMGCQEALFNPKDPQSIANKINTVLTDKSFSDFLKRHGEKQAKKFTWENTAKKTLATFEDLYNSKRNKQTFNIHYNRKKLAYVSPLPPEKTGIADYSAQLIPELACFYEITLITEQTQVDDTWLNANFPIHDINWFKQYATSFDIILYQFGNSSYHHYMFDLLNSHPGIVLLHDFFLSGLLDWVADFMPNKASIFNHELYHSHGFPALNYQKKQGRILTNQTYPCNLSVLKKALGIIVHSQYAIDLAEKWYGVNIVKKFRLINSLSHLNKNISINEKNSAREELGFNQNDFIICSFGNLHPNKLNHRLIQACLDKLRTNKNIYLIFVGEKPYPSYHDELLDLIKNYNLKENVKFTGFTEENLYKSYLLAANIAVQLRANSRGETSACLLTCLAYGIPTIANDNGSIKEIACNALLKIADHFTDLELEQSIDQLYKDTQQTFSDNALSYIRENYHPAKIGKEFYQVIQNFYFDNDYSREQNLIKNLSRTYSEQSNQEDLPAIATVIAANRLAISFPQLLIDISSVIESESSIQQKILIELMSTDSLKFRLEPIYYNKIKNKYFYARQFITHLLNLPDIVLEDSPVNIYPDDTFISLSYSCNENTAIKDLFHYWKAKGIKFYVLICTEQISTMNFFYELAEGCICLKKEYVNSLISHLDSNKPERKMPLKIDFLNLVEYKNISNELFTLIDKTQWSNEWKINDRSNYQEIPSIIRELCINNKKYSFQGDTSYLGNADPNFDLTLISIFKAFCNENSYALDLGANIGLATVALADICKNGKVAAVEPLPPSFEFLKTNIKNANVNNVSLHNFAVGNKKSEISMQARSNFLAGAFIADRYQADKEHFTMKVQIETLDEVFDSFNFDRLDFIKLDLEGYEVFALEGGKKILERFKPTVCLEMNHWCLNVFHRISLPEFQERLRELFPYIYALEHPSYLDFTTVDNFYHIAHEHVTTTYKYFNLVAGFNREEILQKLSLMV